MWDNGCTACGNTISNTTCLSRASLISRTHPKLSKYGACIFPSTTVGFFLFEHLCVHTLNVLVDGWVIGQFVCRGEVREVAGCSVRRCGIVVVPLAAIPIRQYNLLITGIPYVQYSPRAIKVWRLCFQQRGFLAWTCVRAYLMCARGWVCRGSVCVRR